MKIGIKATKFHYSKKETRECTLRLSEDGKTLFWNYYGTNLSSEFMKRYVNLSDVEGIMYGPQSYTFRAYKTEFLIKNFLKELKQEKKPSIEVLQMASPAFTKDLKRLPFSQTQEATIPQKNHNHIEFHSWECVSLKVHNRTVDFVIKNE